MVRKHHEYLFSSCIFSAGAYFFSTGFGANEQDSRHFNTYVLFGNFPVAFHCEPLGPSSDKPVLKFQLYQNSFPAAKKANLLGIANYFLRHRYRSLGRRGIENDQEIRRVPRRHLPTETLDKISPNNGRVRPSSRRWRWAKC